MSEAATDTAAAPATPAPEGSSTPEGTQGQTGSETGTKTGEDGGNRAPLAGEGDNGTGDIANEFALPDEYKEASWAEKVKTQEDLYKLIENQNTLIGKKTIQPIDFDNATDQEIADYHKSLAPEKGVEAYAWGEHSLPEITEPMAEVFVEAGINPHQQKLLAGKFDEVVEKIAGEKLEADTSEDGYMAMMKESFGDDYEKSVGIVENTLKEHASNDDKKIFDQVDNKTRAAVDRTTHNVVSFYEKKIAEMKEEYGIKETGAQAEGGEAGTQVKSKEEQRKEIRTQMREIDGKPNSFKEKQELQEKLNKLL